MNVTLQAWDLHGRPGVFEVRQHYLVQYHADTQEYVLTPLQRLGCVHHFPTLSALERYLGRKAKAIWGEVPEPKNRKERTSWQSS